MGSLAITNNGRNDMVVAGRIIVPGETRHFDEREVPLALRPAAAAPKKPAAEPADPMHQLQGQSVSTIKDAMPGIEEHQLVVLRQLEEESQRPRSTLLAAIGEEHLRRASESN